MKRIFSCCLLLSIVYNSYAQMNNAAAHPNIIFILSDDHTTQAVSAYGSKLTETPNIDRIAREGAILRNQFITNAICGPSRACFLTGVYSHINGYKSNEKQFDNSQATFPEWLQRAGYQTAWIGKIHLEPMPRGFDYWKVLFSQGDYYNPDFNTVDSGRVHRHGYVTDIITSESVRWLQERDRSKPFFLVVGHKATHREWLPALEDLGAYDDRVFPLPPGFHDNYVNRPAAAAQDMSIEKTMQLQYDLKVHVDFDNMRDYSRMDADQRKVFAGYYEGKISRAFDSLQLQGEALLEWKYQRYLRDYLATARSLDRNIGRLLNWIDSNDLSRNTVVIYASDQGFYLGEHGWFDKRFMYEESLRTPFVIRYPGKIKPGTSLDAFTLGIDWGPTLLDVAGISTPDSMQGRSFLPLLLRQKPPKPWRDEVYYHYYEYPEPHRVAPHFGIRTQRFKLIRFYGPTDAWELYDLRKDKNELHNLYNDKQYAQYIAPLKKQLREQVLQYKDSEALDVLEQ